jgi:hypothetical protein
MIGYVILGPEPWNPELDVRTGSEHFAGAHM